MIFDTDIVIFVQRGNLSASTLVDEAVSRYLSIHTYMELMQCAQNKKQLQLTKKYILEMQFTVLPLSEHIGNLALRFVEQHSLSSGMEAGDAIIAATAVAYDMPLCTANKKHFKAITGLDMRVFQPHLLMT